MLPSIVFYFGVKAEGLCPAVAMADVLDDLQHFGENGSYGAMVAVVSGATIMQDERILDIPCLVLGHVVIEVFAHADRHRHLLVIAVVGALALGHVLVEGIDAGEHLLLRVYILAHLPAQTLLTEGTLLCEADGILEGFFSEKGCFLIHRHQFFCKYTKNR